MIFTQFHRGQGLGNQLFSYVSTRAIALKNGENFGVKDFEKFKAPNLLKLDFGEKIPTEYNVYNEYVHGLKSNFYTPISPLNSTDKNVFTLNGNYQLKGLYISEGYFHNYLHLLSEWLSVDSKYEHNDVLVDDICVINLRGGPHYRNSPVFLPQSYWNSAIKRMLEYNSNMNFVVVTDDVDLAKKMFPKYECIHKNVETENQNPNDTHVGMWDYVALKNCKHIICSNSTFSCFPLWTNKYLKYCIAPKYNIAYNHSNGIWSLGSNIFSFVTEYLDRFGNFSSFEKCKIEWKNFYLNNKIYSDEDLKNMYEW